MSVLKAVQVYTLSYHISFFTFIFLISEPMWQVYNTHTDNYMWILKKI